MTRETDPEVGEHRPHTGHPGAEWAHSSAPHPDAQHANDHGTGSAAPRRHGALRLMAEAPGAAAATMPPAPLAIPSYLTATYWWAYVHPRAVGVFEREWLVSAILWGNYARLRDLALEALGSTVHGRTLQVACVYGNLTSRLLSRMAPDAALEVVDILPVQLANLRAKLPTDPRVTLTRADSSSLAMPDASVDQVLLFFLLHEQPESVRRGTLAEAMRVVKPGGRIVIVDYHRPSAWHPLRLLMRGVFQFLEPFAMDLWRHEVEAFLPAGVKPATARKRTWFGGLYQMIEWTR